MPFSGSTGTGVCGTVTDPLLADSDGDRALDGAECVLGTDPNNAAAAPLLANCGPAGDTDGDKLADRVENCYYNTLTNNTDTATIARKMISLSAETTH